VTGKAYTNTGAFTLAPGATITIPIRAVEIGTPSNASPGDIDELETVLPGVACTNAAAVVGTDEESDEDLAQRSLDKLGTLAPNGPRGAYLYAVRTARRPDGSPVNINRVRVSPSSSTGVVTIYVASPAGAPTPDDVEHAAASVEALARPDTVTASVLPATEVPVTRTLTVWARRTDGVSAAAIKALVEAALVRELSTYPIGGIPKPPTQLDGFLYADFIAGVAKSADPTIYDVDGAGPDLPLAEGQVAILSTTITVRLVDV
jgi:phage-related baseplate assembly protein